MRLIADIHHFHRFHSVQLGLLAGACGTGLAAYGTALAIAPQVVSGVPHWLLTAMTLGSMLLPFASVAFRAIDQPELSLPKPTVPPSNDFHQHEDAP